MAPQLTNGSLNPSPCLYSVKAHLKLQLVKTIATGGSFVNITNGDVSTALPGNSGWANFRLLKVSVWGSDDTAAGTHYCAVEMASNSSLDTNSQVFEDYGTSGANRAALHVLPAFAQRELWYPVDTTGALVLFQATQGGAAGLIVQVTLELQSKNETPAFSKYLQSRL